MKVGDLVRRIDNWIKFNPWMSDYEEYGIVIEMPKKVVKNYNLNQIQFPYY